MIGIPVGPSSRATEKRNHLSSANGVCAGDVQTISERISPRERPLDGDVVEVVGRLLDPHAEPEPLGLLAQPDAAVLGAADPAEVVRAEPEDGPVVEHPAGLVAHRRVDDLAVREPADVARHRRLEERLGVRPEHLELPERREVHDRRPLAARPVLVDGAVVVVATSGASSRCTR